MTPTSTATISSERLREMFRLMLTVRTFEQTAEQLLRTGEIYGEIHQYTGQEAVAVGVCTALEPTDVITSTHRGHGHVIAKGGNVVRMMAELFGRDEGYCRGRGGSMHIASLDLGILGANGMVGAGTPIAVGAALAAVRRGTNSVAVSFFGDGAANQGVVHEAMNLAAVYGLPVLFVCENNGYSVSMSTRDSTAVADISVRAGAYGMPGVTVDGMDVMEVYALARASLDRVRNGEGPMLMEAKTYRYCGHFSAESKLLGDRQYRTSDELARWVAKDPIALLRRYFRETDVVASDEMQDLEQAVTAEINEAVEYARAATPPSAATALENLYAVPHPNLVPVGW